MLLKTRRGTESLKSVELWQRLAPESYEHGKADTAHCTAQGWDVSSPATLL